MHTFDQSAKIGKTKPSGPLRFLAMNTRPVFACLSCGVLDREKIKSATKHLLKASDIDSIVITSALRPPRFVWLAVITVHFSRCAIPLNSSYILSNSCLFSPCDFTGFNKDYEADEQEKLDFPEYFNEDGSLKTETEIKIIEADLEKQEKGLIENPLYKTLKDIDQKYDSAVMAKLETESARIAYDATVVNESLKEIDSISKDLFGRGIADLNSYKFTTQEELDKANRLIKDAGANYKILQSFQTDVNSLSTFYNNIENKNAQAEYAEGFKGVMNEVRLGASNGRLNTALISYDLGRPVNMNDVEDTKEIISTIVKESKFQKGLLNSKEFASFNAAGNSDEFLSTEQFNLLMSSAAGPEIMASLVGNSLSQMVTTGRC